MYANCKTGVIAVIAVAVAMSGGCGQGRAVFPAADAPVVENWLYTSIGDFDERVKRLSDRPDIAGVQILVPWKMVEPTKGEYDFSQVDRVLSYLNTRGKKMFLQIQDRFFTLPARLPRYLLVEPEYAGGAAPAGGNNGLGEQPPGAIAAQWNPNVRERFHRLMAALAKRFDGKIEGFNLPETSTQIDIKNDKTGYTCGANFEATLDNMRYGLQVFKKSKFVQYVNFWECEWNNDHKYMERTFNLAREKGIGVGGPDVLPNKPAQMANAYPFFNKYKNQVPLVAMAVQEPDFQYINEVTGKPYARKEFVDFARDYLGARILFWATSAPWLGS